MLVNNSLSYSLQMLLNSELNTISTWTPRDNKINEMGGAYRRSLHMQIDLAFLKKRAITAQYFDGILDILQV